MPMGLWWGNIKFYGVRVLSVDITSQSREIAAAASPTKKPTSKKLKEVNFMFPIDDRVCTIDEMALHPPSNSSNTSTMLWTQQKALNPDEYRL